jgi:hypothetical protein
VSILLLLLVRRFACGRWVLGVMVLGDSARVRGMVGEGRVEGDSVSFLRL